MKKIFTLILIMAFSVQICLAEGEPEEDINSFFTDEATAEQPVSAVTETNAQQVSSESSTAEALQGHLEFNESEAEQDSIPLNQNVATNKVNFATPKKVDSTSVFATVKKPTFQPMQSDLATASKFNATEYNVKPVSTSYSQKLGKFSFGTMYDSSLDSASPSYSTGLFSKYEGKHFAFSTAFSKDTNLNSDSFNDKIYVAPELKLTKRLSLLDVMQTDTNQINKKNEIVLRYTPHVKKYADDVQFEVGVGQSFYEDNYVKSSLKFSTKFKI